MSALVNHAKSAETDRPWTRPAGENDTQTTASQQQSIYGKVTRSRYLLWQRKETTQETLQGTFRKHGIELFKFDFYLKFHNLEWRVICFIISAGIGFSQSTRRNCSNIFPAASQARHCKKTLRDKHKFHDHFLEYFLLVLYYFFTPFIRLSYLHPLSCDLSLIQRCL